MGMSSAYMRNSNNSSVAGVKGKRSRVLREGRGEQGQVMKGSMDQSKKVEFYSKCNEQPVESLRQGSYVI